MELSQYAKKVGVTYRTAWFWYKEGQIKGYQMPTGTIVITEDQTTAPEEKVAIYARVSSSEHQSNLCKATRETNTNICRPSGSAVKETPRYQRGSNHERTVDRRS